jgi:hypothetical protein
VGDISEMVNKMDINPVADRDVAGSLEAEDGHSTDIYNGLFHELPAPILLSPPQASPSSRLSKTRVPRKKKTLAAMRTSLRQAARPCTVPVDERATRKLMRELEFVSSQQQQAPDAAVAEYVDLYTGDLPELAVEAIKKATRLGNKKMIKVLEAIVQEADAVEMET